MILRAYRGLTGLASPILNGLLRRRVRAGKEDAARLQERRGEATLPRPAGSLIWMHAASVGEATSAEPLLAAFLERDPALHILLTSGTVTAARMLAPRLPARAIHQYVPLDHPRWVARFLDHWRPDAAIWIESELWPNLILQADARAIPLALVNARMSERSRARWSRAGGALGDLLSRFQIRLAQSPEAADRLSSLSASDKPFTYLGTLKAACAPSLPAGGMAALESLRLAMAGRPVWLAASTHPGEEAVVAQVHRALKGRFPKLLTLVAPRHPVRAPAVRQELERAGLAITTREKDGLPSPDSDIFLIDRLGEMGVFQRLADIVFLAGSLSGRLGGHNPLEAAHCGKPVLFGPDMTNQRAAADALLAVGAAETVADGAALTLAVGRLLDDPGERLRRGQLALSTARAEAAAVERIRDALLPILPAYGPARVP